MVIATTSPGREGAWLIQGSWGATWHTTIGGIHLSNHSSLYHSKHLKFTTMPQGACLLGAGADGVPHGVQLPAHDVVKVAEQALLQRHSARVYLRACSNNLLCMGCEQAHEETAHLNCAHKALTEHTSGPNVIR